MHSSHRQGRPCYDNAAVETFFKSLTAELIWRRNWATRRETELALFQYINGFTNPAPSAFSPRMEKPSGLRTKGSFNETQGQAEGLVAPRIGLKILHKTHKNNQLRGFLWWRVAHFVTRFVALTGWLYSVHARCLDSQLTHFFDNHILVGMKRYGR
jgi:hypothetical protein